MTDSKPVSRVKQWRRRVTYSDSFMNFIASLASFFIKCYIRLLRIQIVLHDEFSALDRNKTLVAFWHGRLLLPIWAFGYMHMVIMTDKSWAGEVLARILRKFGHLVVRGSSKRGGFRGVLDMKSVMQRGHGGALAVDGPRGPIYRTKPGILYLSHKLGYPVVPLTFGVDRAWILENTWDRFVLPKPFAKCLVEMGAPIWETTVKGGMQTEQLDEILNRFTESADERICKK
jgi:lysophospholipid acyltransferase (LPLAT)-like uncharacterized protein